MLGTVVQTSRLETGQNAVVGLVAVILVQVVGVQRVVTIIVVVQQPLLLLVGSDVVPDELQSFERRFLGQLTHKVLQRV